MIWYVYQDQIAILGSEFPKLAPKNGSRGCVLLHKSDIIIFKAVNVALSTETDPQKYDVLYIF